MLSMGTSQMYRKLVLSTFLFLASPAAGSLENSSSCQGSARFRPLFLQRVCQSASTVRDKLGFNRLQPTVAGCTQQLLDQTRMLSMQEDAYCHRISSEVMKHFLYEPAVAPCQRRILNRSRRASKPARAMQSLPVTPGQSNATTPLLTPTTSYNCFAVFSCATTPRATSPETPDGGSPGLASVLSPRPRYVHASCSELSNNPPSSPNSNIFLNVPSVSDHFCSQKGLSAPIHYV